MNQSTPGTRANPAEVAASAARRAEEATKTPEQLAHELSEAVDELLARDVQGAEEAAVLEKAQEIVNHALGRGN